MRRSVKRTIGSVECERHRVAEPGSESVCDVRTMGLADAAECARESPDTAAVRKLAARVVAAKITVRVISLAGVRGRADVHVQHTIGSCGDAARAVFQLGDAIDHDFGWI